MLSLSARLCILGALALGVVIGGAGLPAPATTPSAYAQSIGCDVSPSELATDAEEQAALDAVNAYRASRGLPPLVWSESLVRGTAWKSRQMAMVGVLDHDDPGRSWLDRIVECGYRASPWVAENLGVLVETGRGVFMQWQDSGPHQANMLDPQMKVAGIARARGATGWFWTAVFGAEPEGDAGTVPAEE